MNLQDKKVFIISEDFKDLAIFKPKSWREHLKNADIILFGENVLWYCNVDGSSKMVPSSGNISPRLHVVRIRKKGYQIERNENLKDPITNFSVPLSNRQNVREDLQSV